MKQSYLSIPALELFVTLLHLWNSEAGKPKDNNGVSLTCIPSSYTVISMANYNKSLAHLKISCY